VFHKVGWSVNCIVYVEHALKGVNNICLSYIIFAHARAILSISLGGHNSLVGDRRRVSYEVM